MEISTLYSIVDATNRGLVRRMRERVSLIATHLGCVNQNDRAQTAYLQIVQCLLQGWSPDVVCTKPDVSVSALICSADSLHPGLQE